jgi:ATP-binding cassette subfamily F protein 3
VEGRATPRGVLVEAPRARESAAQAAARRRAEAEERNRRYRRTRDLRQALSVLEADARTADAELAEAAERLADPTVYADAALVRELIERHNAARERADELAAEWTRLSTELEEAEAQDALAESRR